MKKRTFSKKSANPFSRPRGKRKFVAERVLIVTEGEKTEPSYFEKLVTSLNLTSVRIERSKGTSPTNVVDSAVDFALATDNCKTAYCVFDQDRNFSNYKQAIDRVKQENRKSQGVRFVAVPSIPCFEFWYLLHVKYTRKSYKDSVSPCVKLIENMKKFKVFSGYEKSSCGNFFDELVSLRNEAITNAARVISEARKEGCEEFYEDPSTRMHVVVEDLTRISTGLS